MNASQESICTVSGSKEEMGQLFPHAVDTRKGSVMFAKNCTLLALSVISYSRGMFPVHAYTNKMYKGHAIKLLDGHGNCEEAQSFWKWMKSACEALEKGYMRELVLEVLSVEHSVVEYYAIEYRYGENDIMCSITATEKTIAQFDYVSFQAAFVNFMASIASFVKALEPLPAAYMLQLRVNYYDAITPECYTPDYFRDEMLDSNWNKSFEIDTTGSLATPFHQLTVRMASRLKRRSEGNSAVSDGLAEKKSKVETKPAQRMGTQELQKSLMSSDENEVNAPNTVNERAETSVAPLGIQTGPQISDYEAQENSQLAIPGRSVPSMLVPTSGGTKSAPTMRQCNTQNYTFGRVVEMNCICNLNENKRAIFQCYKCYKWHHLVCYRRKPTYIIRSTEKYTCAQCAMDDGDAECMDHAMAALDVPFKNIQDLAVYRHVIFRLQWFTLINIKTLKSDFHISEEQARRAISKLTKKNMLRPCTRSEDFLLNSQQLMAFINSYFK